MEKENENKSGTLGSMIKRLRKEEVKQPENITENQSPSTLSPEKETGMEKDESPKKSPEEESSVANEKLSDLVNKIKKLETEGQLSPEPISEPEPEPEPETDVSTESPGFEESGTEETAAELEESKIEAATGEKGDSLRTFLNGLVKSQDAPLPEKEASSDSTVEPPTEVVIEDSADESSPASEEKGEAKKTKWSEEVDESKTGVVSVDDILSYSDLILPSGATFEVEDIHLGTTSSAFDIVDKGTVLSEIDEIWKPGYPSSVVPSSVGETSVEDIEEKKGFTGFLKGFSLRKPQAEKIEEYDTRIHGPLVNLSMTPVQGQEEIELYPVNEPYAYIRVIYDNSTHEYTYQVIEPVLNSAEEELLLELAQRLFETLDVNTKGMTRETAVKALRDAVDEILRDYGIKLAPANREKVLYHIEKNFLGDGLIDAIMHDKYIEDISCDGLNTPIFVYHTSYESIQTNLMYTDAVKLDSFVTKLAQRAGKYISISEPMLDATMSDGSRIQMTLGKEVTAHGSTFTIRKFRDEPITPTDLIEWQTFSPLSIAFLWLAVENGKSCIFAGGTASGKTTSLNAISLFIPPLAKIVTLEDTRELKLPHPNWIPSVTRDSFDTGGKGSIDMYELLRAALRQRPEYLLVGEVRGQEALTLFQAMSTGHVTYSTMHADSVASVVHRLENPPLNVPRNMLNALDIVSVQVQARIGGQRIRRNKQLIEILDIDPRTNELITNEVFGWNSATDEIRYSGKSYILETVMEERGWSEARMREELKRRQEILEWMRLKKLRHYKDVAKVLVSYHRDPESVMDIVRADLYE
jgi:flagellar protein FlaI